MRSAPRESASPRAARRLSWVSLPIDAHHVTSIDRATSPGDAPEGSSSRCQSCDRSGAAAAERAQEGTFGRRLRPRLGVVELREQGEHALVIRSALDRQRPLAGRGKHGLVGQPFRDGAFEPEPSNPGGGEHHGVVLALRDLADTRVDVPRGSTGSRDRARTAASWALRRRLLVPITAPAGNSAREPAVRATRQSRTSSLAVTAPMATAGLVLRRQVLEGVHGDIDVAVAQRALELSREEPLAADRGQRLAGVLRAVACRGDDAGRAHERLSRCDETRSD
jgi:hypothetical protein